MTEFVYLAAVVERTRPAQGPVKIGTAADVRVEMEKLSESLSMGDFECLFACRPADPARLKGELHKFLAPYRVRKDREFFKVDAYIIKLVLMLLNACHRLNEGFQFSKFQESETKEFYYMGLGKPAKTPLRAEAGRGAPNIPCEQDKSSLTEKDREYIRKSIERLSKSHPLPREEEGRRARYIECTSGRDTVGKVLPQTAVANAKALHHLSDNYMDGRSVFGITDISEAEVVNARFRPDGDLHKINSDYRNGIMSAAMGKYVDFFAG